MPAPANDVKSLFGKALELASPVDRAAFLDEACADNPDLRREVDGLLQALEKAGDFMKQTSPLPPGTHSPLTERVGSMIGPYKLLEQIGEGGMGTVFLAEQTEPVRRRVALKIIKPGMDSAQVIARFEAERQALALMDHPNIARVLDAGTTPSEPGGVSPGRPYFVMELVKGTPITDFCDQNRMTPRERLELFIPVCQAIQHAHQKGIIHRDIKPSNVLVAIYDAKPVPKVIDFGIAKATDQPLTEKTLFTRHGQIVGTFEYMSPEQATLDSLDVDTRSDIYSLAVLLYELLTGTTPLDRERLREAALGEILRLIREEEPPRPSNRLSASGGGLPMIAAHRNTDSQKLPAVLRGDLDWIIMKGLDKDRARRYDTASALAADLRRYLCEEPVEARPPSAWYRFRKLARRNRTAVMAGTLVAAALLLGTVVAWLFALEAGRNAAWANEEKEKAKKIAAQAEANEMEVKKVNIRLLAMQEEQERTLYANSMQLVQVAWRSDDASRALDLLQETIPAHGQKDLRNFEWYYWNRLIHGAKEVVPLKGGEKPRPYAEFSPGQTLLASVRLDDNRVIVRLWDTKTGSVVLDLKGPVLEPPPPGRMRALNPVISRLVFSADGKWLAASISAATVPIGGPAFGGGGKGFEDSGPKVSLRELWVWDTTSGTELWHKALPVVQAASHSIFHFHPTGDRIAVHVQAGSKGETVIEERTRKDGELLQTLGVPVKAKKDGCVTRLLCLSLDGKKLLLNQNPTFGKSKEEQPSALMLWDVETDEQIWRVLSPVDSSSSLMGLSSQIAGFSPDGKRLFFVQEINLGVKKSAIWVCDAANGKTLCQCQEDSLAPATNFVRQFQFSPDGKSLIGKPRNMETPGTPIRVWDTATGKLRHKVLIPAQRVWDVAFSAGGDSLCIAAGKTVQIWPVSRPSPFRVSADPDERLFYPSLSADGRRLAVVTWPNDANPDDEPHKRSTILVLDTATGKERFRVKTLRAPVRKLVLSADGKRLIAALAPLTAGKLKSEIVVWDVEEKREIVSCPLQTVSDVEGKSSTVSHGLAAIGSDGQLAAVYYQQTENKFGVKVWKIPDAKEVFGCKQICEGTFTGDNLAAISFSPDGSLLFFAAAERVGSTAFLRKWVPHILDLKSCKELASPPALHLEKTGFGATVETPTSMNRNLLAWYDGPTRLGSNVNKSYDIVVADLDPKGKNNLRLMGHTMPVTSMAFSPDGQRLASLGSTSLGFGYAAGPKEIKIWDLHKGQDVLTLTAEARGGTVQFSADGHRLFFLAGPVGDSGMPWFELHSWDATPLPDASP